MTIIDGKFLLTDSGEKLTLSAATIVERDLKKCLANRQYVDRQVHIS